MTFSCGSIIARKLLFLVGSHEGLKSGSETGEEKFQEIAFSGWILKQPLGRDGGNQRG